MIIFYYLCHIRVISRTRSHGVQGAYHPNRKVNGGRLQTKALHENEGAYTVVLFQVGLPRPWVTLS